MQLSSNKLLLPLMMLGVMTVSGCASQQQGADSQASVNSHELGLYLNSGTAAATVLTNSPWGTNMQVMADQPYYAASGRTCRQLQVTQPTGSSESHIACKTQSGQWNLTRDLKQP